MEKIFETRWRINLYKLIGFTARSMLWLCNVTVKEKGKLASPHEAPLILFAPHSWWLDGMYWILLNRRVTPVAAKECATLAKAGPVAMACHPITVIRTDSKSKQLVVETIKHRAGLPGVYPQVIIAPEGAVTNGKSLVRFKERVHRK